MRTRAGPPATKCELPLTVTYGDAWRAKRDNMTMQEWRRNEEHFVQTLSEVWGLKGFWAKGEKGEGEGKEGEGKAKGRGGGKGKGKKAARKAPKYEPHTGDAQWQEGERSTVTFVVDNHALVEIVSGRKRLSGQSPVAVLMCIARVRKSSINRRLCELEKASV